MTTSLVQTRSSTDMAAGVWPLDRRCALISQIVGPNPRPRRAAHLFGAFHLTRPGLAHLFALVLQQTNISPFNLKRVLTTGPLSVDFKSMWFVLKNTEQKTEVQRKNKKVRTLRWVTRSQHDQKRFVMISYNIHMDRKHKHCGLRAAALQQTIQSDGALSLDTCWKPTETGRCIREAPRGRQTGNIRLRVECRHQGCRALPSTSTSIPCHPTLELSSAQAKLKY